MLQCWYFLEFFSADDLRAAVPVLIMIMGDEALFASMTVPVIIGPILEKVRGVQLHSLN